MKDKVTAVILVGGVLVLAPMLLQGLLTVGQLIVGLVVGYIAYMIGRAFFAHEGWK